MKNIKKIIGSILVWLLLTAPGFAAGLTPNLMNEDCNSITSWTDADSGTGDSKLNPAGQFEFGSGASTGGVATRRKNISSPPDKVSVEISVYFDDVGTVAEPDGFRFLWGTATWSFRALFCSDGLFVFKAGGSTEVGTNIVTVGSGGFHVFRFQIDKSGGESAATVEVFLDNVSQATVDCDYEIANVNGRVILNQYGTTTAAQMTHINYIRIATGLGEINDTDNPIVNIF